MVYEWIPSSVAAAVAAQRSLSSDTAFDLAGGFSEEEQDALCRLTNREYSVRAGSDEEWALWVGLADLLFAYCYDLRMTGGEPTVESAHNMSRLSCSLSWLEDYFSQQSDHDRHISVADCIKFSLRRSIVYPYLRVWKLARKVLADVAKLLFLGKRAILKCLLRIRAVFEHTDTHYLLNKLYVDDYCIWIQQQQQHHQDDALQHGLHTDYSLYEFAKEYNSAKSAIEKRPHQGKELMGFNIPALEQWASSDSADRYCQSGETDIDVTIPAHLLLLHEVDSHRLRIPDLHYLLPVAETRQEGPRPSPFLIPEEGAAAGADNPSDATAAGGCWLRPVATKRRGVPELQQSSDIH